MHERPLYRLVTTPLMIRINACNLYIVLLSIKYLLVSKRADLKTFIFHLFLINKLENHKLI